LRKTPKSPPPRPTVAAWGGSMGKSNRSTRPQAALLLGTGSCSSWLRMSPKTVRGTAVAVGVGEGVEVLVGVGVWVVVGTAVCVGVTAGRGVAAGVLARAIGVTLVVGVLHAASISSSATMNQGVG